MTIITNKLVLITGGAGAIGLGIAKAVGARGGRIALADLDHDRLCVAQAALAATGLSASIHLLDAASPAAWKATFDACERDAGGVDILCNNAGVTALGVEIQDITEDYWARVLNVNLTGPMLGIQEYLRRRRLREGGHILNTASLAGLGTIIPKSVAYTASKAGLIALSEVLALDLAPLGINVSILCPGAVRSELWRTSRGALGLSPITEPPPDSRRGSASPDAASPDGIGEEAVKGIEENRLFIITHKAPRAAAERRFTAISEGFDRAVF